MRKWISFLKTLTLRFFSDQCPMRAASLTFTTLLSIVPLVIFIFYILSFFPALHSAGKQIEQFIVHNFVASSATVISQQLQDFVNQAHILSWTTIISLVFFAVLLIFNIVSAVNGVWHVTFHRDSLISFTVYLIALIIAPVIFAILLLFSSYLSSLPLLSHVVEIDVVRKPFLSISPFLIEWIVFSLFHWMIPSCRVFFRFAVISGLITAVLFEIAKWGFVLYFHYFSTYQLVYGALAAIPIFFIWIYVSWMIIMVGVLICQLLQTKCHV
jgi:membrane protein